MPAKYARRRTPIREMSNSCNHVRNYSDEELEFLKAMDRYKQERRRPHPSWAEVLGIAKGLGWTKEPSEGAP